MFSPSSSNGSTSGGSSSRIVKSLVQLWNTFEHPDRLLRFFDRKEYYTVLGDSALLVARDYCNTVAGMKTFGPEYDDLSYLHVNMKLFSEITPDLLLRRGFSVEVWTHEDGKWSISRQGSPGNVDDFEDICVDKRSGFESSRITVLSISSSESKGITTSLAYVDTSSRSFFLSEFVDNDQFASLESALLQIGARECLIAFDSQAYDVKKVRDVLLRCDVAITEKKRSDFHLKDPEHEFRRLLSSESQYSGEFRLSSAILALAVLVRHLSLCSDASNHGKYSLKRFDLSQFVRLDSAAMKALNLFPQPSDAHKSMSLFGLLNHCKTSMGTRLLAQWIRQPLISAVDINSRLNCVECFCAHPIQKQQLRDEHFRRIPDIQRISRKLVRKRASLEDLVRLYEIVVRLPRLQSVVAELCSLSHSGDDSILNHAKHTLSAAESEFANFGNMIEKIVDLDEIINNRYLIRSDFDPELQVLKEQLDDVDADICSAFESIAKSLKLDSQNGKEISLEKNTKLGYHCRVPKKHEKLVRGNKSLSSETSQNQVRFTNLELRQLNGRFSEAENEYLEKQSTLVSKAVDVAATYIPVLDRIQYVLAELDVLTSFAEACSRTATPYCRPKIEIDPDRPRRLFFQNSRHPCLEALPGASFISNSVDMQEDCSRFLLVTGPNCGGKSTFIRQTGVLALMAQIGCFVPASEAIVSPVDCICARVGASDSQLRGISTFMSEMLETSAILQTATSRSLIIIDELGRGTSTYDGYGLACAISKHIIENLQCFTLFATHFHELTDLEEEMSGVRNLHVSAHVQEGRLAMLYRIEDGPCEQSFGIHVAEMAGFPPSVIEMAKQKAEELEEMEHGHQRKRTADSVDQGYPHPEEGFKRRKVIDLSSFRVINDLLVEYCSLPMTRSPSSLEALSSFVKKVESCPDPHIMELLGNKATGDVSHHL